MTYYDLLMWIESLTPEQQGLSVTVKDEASEEYFPCSALATEGADDVLDKGHPFILFSR